MGYRPVLNRRRERGKGPAGRSHFLSTGCNPATGLSTLTGAVKVSAHWHFQKSELGLKVQQAEKREASSTGHCPRPTEATALMVVLSVVKTQTGWHTLCKARNHQLLEPHSSGRGHVGHHLLPLYTERSLRRIRSVAKVTLRRGMAETM